MTVAVVAEAVWASVGAAYADTWPARSGDQRIAADIAATLSPRIASLRSGLEFDGGDLLCDGQSVFATSAVLHRNLNRTIGSRGELIRTLEAELHRRVILMDDSPDHHAGMFMMAAADHTMVIADPKPARNLLPEGSEILQTLPGGADFSDETQHKLDAIADQCRAIGLRVETSERSRLTGPSR